MLELFRDSKIAWRSLRRRPGFALVVIATFGLTLGATVATIALVDAVLLRPLPFDRQDRLVALWNLVPGAEGQIDTWRVSGRAYRQWRDHGDALEGLALYGYASRTLGGEEPIQVEGSRVTSGFFPLLGVTAQVGRTLESDDFAAGAAAVTVLSHGLWHQRFGGDAGVVGSTILLDGEPVTVIGVLPRQLMPLVAQHSGTVRFGSGDTHFWLPMTEPQPDHGSHVYGALARLAPDMTLADARLAMDELMRRLAAERPAGERDLGVRVVPLRDAAVGDVRPSLRLLAAGIALVLLVACANVANLFLVRATAQRRDLAVRAALGAGRARLWRQVTVEGVLLAIAGAAVGTALADGILRVLPRLVPHPIPRLDEAAVGPRVLLASLAICLVCGVLCTAMPAARASRRPLASALRGRGGDGPAVSRLRQALVAGEVALAVVLVITAGLLLRSLERLRAVDPGFAAEQVLTLDLQLPARAYGEMHRLTGFYDRLLESLGAIPGVTSAAAAYDHPLTANWTQGFAIEGVAAAPESAPTALFRTVTPGYFDTVGIALREGRRLRAGDDAEAPGAAVVNRAFVRAFLGDRPALGQRLEIYTTQWQWGEAIPDRFEIVGVVEDVRFAGLAAPSAPAFYLPLRQTPQFEMTVFLATDRAPRSLLPEVRARLEAIDPGLPIVATSTLEELLDRQVAKPRFDSAALSAFSLGALLIAMLGLASVLTLAVRQRRRDIGIRLALGAPRPTIGRWALAFALRPVLIGLVLGVAGALAVGRLLRSVLFEVSPADPLVLAVVPAALLAVAALACLAPTLRACRVDPIEVLREE